MSVAGLVKGRCQEEGRREAVRGGSWRCEPGRDRGAEMRTGPRRWPELPPDMNSLEQAEGRVRFLGPSLIPPGSSGALEAPESWKPGRERRPRRMDWRGPKLGARGPAQGPRGGRTRPGAASGAPGLRRRWRGAASAPPRSPCVDQGASRPVTSLLLVSKPLYFVPCRVLTHFIFF